MVAYDPSTFPNLAAIAAGYHDDIYNDLSGYTLPEYMANVDAAILDLNSRVDNAVGYDFAAATTLTPASPPADIVAGFNDLATFISTNAPGRTLLIPPGVWTFDAKGLLASNIVVAGADPIHSVLKLVDNAAVGVTAVLAAPTAPELSGVVIRNLTIDGNRYNQTNFSITAGGTVGIELTGSGHRHHIRIEDVSILRPWNYGIGASGTGPKDHIWYIRVYVENAGGDGFDNRGGVPWDRYLYMEDCAVYGHGFNDDYSSTAFEMRGCWKLINPHVEFVQRFTHAAIRFHGGDGLNGSGNRYGNMYSSVVGAFVGLTGHAKAYGVVGKDPSTAGQPPGEQLVGLVTPRPTPTPIGSIGSTSALASYTFTDAALDAANAWWRLPRPWKPVEMCIVTNCTTAVAAIPNEPTMWGLIWKQQATTVVFNTRMTIFRAMPGFCPNTPTAGSHFSAVDAHDWSQPVSGNPNTPAVALHSAFPVTSSLVITFPGSQVQQFCQVGIVEIDYGSTYCGKIDTGGDGTWDTDYGEHAKDAYIQSVGAAQAGSNATATPSITLAALQSYETNPAGTGLDGGVDPGGTKIENSTGAWFYNRGTSSRVLTPGTGNAQVIQNITAGRVLTMIASLGGIGPTGPDSTPNGTASAADDYLMIAHEYRTGRPLPASP